MERNRYVSWSAKTECPTECSKDMEIIIKSLIWSVPNNFWQKDYGLNSVRVLKGQGFENMRQALQSS